MARPFAEEALVLASHNPGKAREIADLLEPFKVAVRSVSEFDLKAPAETGVTFSQNAELKAKTAAEATGLVALADDSGLAVSALAGRPGIRSARWAGPNQDFNSAMHRVHEMMEGHPDDSARFVCALALCWPDGHCETFEGTVEGQIVWPPRGSLGFGYDPIFVPEGHAITFGEMAPEEKHKISHRADAFRKLIDACFVK
ncbi:MAG: RdgB/HAM1 family non-canonical purine NTP pyrophosphatase [Alphaproteobacteria bacterium]|nr:RdgB/HAM1 family non-canonical purine NTP pyrophosphatase [Alphaproteobacteria bacterium]